MVSRIYRGQSALGHHSQGNRPDPFNCGWNFSLVVWQMLETGVLGGVDQLYYPKVDMAAAQILNESVTVLGSLHSSICMSQHIYPQVSNKLHMVAPACNPSSQEAEAE